MFEKIKDQIVEQCGIDADEITMESRFDEDLDLDSLDLFELVMALDDQYGIEIPSEDLEGMKTVADIVNYLKDKGIE